MAKRAELLAAEQKQVEIDHHVPTAGAMTDHILANLFIQGIKLHQAKWYLKGEGYYTFKPVLKRLIEDNQTHFDQLGELLIDEGQKPSSISTEYQAYTMLAEDSANKYDSVVMQVEGIIADFDRENLFVDRAIKLARKEEREVLAQFLVRLRGYNNRQIRDLQAVLGRDPRASLDEDDDDE